MERLNNGLSNVHVTISSEDYSEYIEACSIAIAYGPLNLGKSFFTLPSPTLCRCSTRVMLASPGDEASHADSILQSHKMVVRSLLEMDDIEFVKSAEFEWRLDCIKRVFNLLASDTVPIKKDKSGGCISTSFERISSDILNGLQPLCPQFRHIRPCILLGGSSRTDDFTSLSNITNSEALSRGSHSLDYYLGLWRSGLDQASLGVFLKASSINFHKSPLTQLEISDVPDSFFDLEDSDMDFVNLCTEKEELGTFNAVFANSIPRSDLSTFRAKMNQAHVTRIVTSSVAPSSPSPDDICIRRRFIESQAACNSTQDDEDSETGYSGMSSFICDDDPSESPVDNSGHDSLMGFYRQSLLHSQSWNGFTKNLNQKRCRERTIELSDFEDLDWDDIE